MTTSAHRGRDSTRNDWTIRVPEPAGSSSNAHSVAVAHPAPAGAIGEAARRLRDRDLAGSTPADESRPVPAAEPGTDHRARRSTSEPDRLPALVAPLPDAGDVGQHRPHPPGCGLDHGLDGALAADRQGPHGWSRRTARLSEGIREAGPSPQSKAFLRRYRRAKP